MTEKIVVKKVVVGTPVKRVTAGSFSITTLGGVDVTRTESDGSILAYKSSTDAYEITNLRGDNNLTVAYDSASNEYNFTFSNESITGNLVPTTDSTFDLGDSAKKWKDLYLSGQTIHLGGLKIQDSGGEFVVKDSNDDVVLNTITLDTTKTTLLDYNSTTGQFTFRDSDIAQTNIAETFHQGLTIDNGATIDSASIGNLEISGNEIRGNTVSLRADSASTNYSYLRGPGATNNYLAWGFDKVSIYHNNSIKLDTTFYGVDINGRLNADSASITTAATIQDLTVSDSAKIVGQLTVGGNLNVTGDLVYDDMTADSATFSGSVAIGTDLSVGGNLNVAGDLVYDDMTADSATFAGTVSVGTNITSPLGRIVNLTGDSAKVTNIANTQFTGSQATFDSVNITTLNATNLTFSSASITDLTVDSAKIGGIDLTGNNLTTTGKLFYANVFSNEVDLPSASTYHGMFAHVHATGRGYFAHGGAWHRLVDSDTTGEQQVYALYSNNARVTNAQIDSATITNLANTQFTGSQATIDSADITTIKSTTATITNATVDSATITNLANTQLTGSQATFDSANIGGVSIENNDITTSGKIYYANVFSQLSDLPDASAYHGMFAHVHATGKGYFAHGGAWHQLLDKSSANDSATITNLANTQFTGSQATLDSATITNIANTQFTGSQATIDSANIGTLKFTTLTNTTSDITEGTNLYYTTARADSDAKASLLGGTGVTYDSSTGVISIGQPVGTTDNVTFAQTTIDSAILDGINFNVLTSRHANAAGTVFFDSDHQKGLSVVLDTQNNANPDVTLNIGQEIFLYVHNQTGAAINNGDAVYISGTAHGKHPQVTKARANTSTTSSVFGLATMDIPDNAHGWVTRYGLVRDVNTGGMTAGSLLFLSPDSAGVVTETPVTVDTGFPHHVGRVITADSTNGVILVDGMSEHFDDLRVENKLKTTQIVADSASLLNVQFDITTFDSHQPYSEGLLYYDNKHKALNYYDDIVGMNHEIGLQEHQRVFNNSGALIRKGSALYFSGNYTSGIIDVPTVGLADATDVNAYNAQGLAAQDIADNSYGHCIIAGQLTEVNTSHLNDGTNFFVSVTTPGSHQNASPTYPNFPMCLGWVVQSGDSDNGILLVNQQNHSVRSFRVQTSAHIGTDLQVDGNLTILGSQTTVGQSNVTQGSPFYRLNEGDAIGEAGTTYSGTGLDDAFFSGHFTGTTAQTYYVRIDGVGTGAGGVDTFEVALGDDSVFASPILTKVAITGDAQEIHSADNISVEFGATTGHDSGDTWEGVASPVNVDTGFFTNRNTGTSGVGYTHMGLYFDVSDEKWKLLDEYDSTPTGTIDTADSSFSLATLVADTFEGSLTGAVTGNASTATALANGRNFELTGQITASAVSFDGTGNVTLVTDIAAGVIKDSDIASTANIADSKLATISTAGKVNNSATTATDANTGSTIVARDASGNFTAGTVTLNDLNVGNLHVDSADIIKISRDNLTGNKGLTYTSSTGVFDIDSSNVKGMFSGNKGLAYNSSTGVFDIDSSNVKGMFAAGSGIVYDSSTGNISLNNLAANVDSGEYGSASLVPVITVNTHGLIDSIGTVSVAGVSTFTYDSAAHTLTIGTADGGSFTQFIRSTSGVDSGTYGSASLVPQITVDRFGQIDSIGTINVAGVSSTTFDSATGQFTINTADGGSFVKNVTSRFSNIPDSDVSLAGNVTLTSSGVFTADSALIGGSPASTRLLAVFDRNGTLLN